MKKRFILTLVVCVTFVFTSCGVETTQKSLTAIPDSGYNMVLTMNLAEIRNSEVGRNLTAGGELSSDLSSFSLAMELNKDHGLDEPLELLLVTEDQKSKDALVKMLAEGEEVTEDKVDAGDYKYYLAKSENNDSAIAYYSAETYELIGHESSLKDAVAHAAGEEKALPDSEAYQEAAAMLDENAQITLLMWNVEGYSTILKEQMQTMPALKQADEELYNLLGDVNTIACSLRLDSEAHVSLRLKFAGEENAGTASEALTSFHAALNTPEALEAVNEDFFYALDTEKLSTALADLQIKHEGATVEILWSVQDVGSILGNTFFEQAAEYQKMSETANLIAKYGQAVEIYKIDFWRIGAPRVDDFKQLKEILADTEILGGYGGTPYPILDAWGNELLYILDDTTMGSGEYTIISYGKDEAPGPEAEDTHSAEDIYIKAETRLVKKSEQDIIWKNGKFVQVPKYKVQ